MADVQAVCNQNTRSARQPPPRPHVAATLEQASPTCCSGEQLGEAQHMEKGAPKHHHPCCTVSSPSAACGRREPASAGTWCAATALFCVDVPTPPVLEAAWSPEGSCPSMHAATQPRHPMPLESGATTGSSHCVRLAPPSTAETIPGHTCLPDTSGCSHKRETDAYVAAVLPTQQHILDPSHMFHHTYHHTYQRQRGLPMRIQQVLLVGGCCQLLHTAQECRQVQQHRATPPGNRVPSPERLQAMPVNP